MREVNAVGRRWTKAVAMRTPVPKLDVLVCSTDGGVLEGDATGGRGSYGGE